MGNLHKVKRCFRPRYGLRRSPRCNLVFYEGPNLRVESRNFDDGPAHPQWMRDGKKHARDDEAVLALQNEGVEVQLEAVPENTKGNDTLE